MKQSCAVLVLFVAGVLAGCGSSTVGSSSTHSSTQASSTAITGFGATDAVWNQTHKAVAGFTPGAVYDADPSLPKVNGNTGARYNLVDHTNGHVDMYEYHFANMSISAAKANVLRTQFPSDVRIAWFVRMDTCAKMMVRSAKLARAIGTALEDKKGTALIEFSSGVNEDTYNPQSVNDALLMLSPLLTPRQAGTC